MKKVEDYKQEYQEQEGADTQESWWDDFINSYDKKEPIFYEASIGITGELLGLLKQEGWQDYTDGLAETGEILPPNANPEEHGYIQEEEDE